MVENARVWYGESDHVNLIADQDVYATIPRGSKEDLKTDIQVAPVLKAPFTQGQEVGRATVVYDDQSLADVPVVVAQDVPESGLFSRLWDAIMLFFINFFASNE